MQPPGGGARGGRVLGGEASSWTTASPCAVSQRMKRLPTVCYQPGVGEGPDGRGDGPLGDRVSEGGVPVSVGEAGQEGLQQRSGRGAGQGEVPHALGDGGLAWAGLVDEFGRAGSGPPGRGGWCRRTRSVPCQRENAEMAAAIEADTALGRFGEVADIASVVAFLASNESRWVTAQVIEASGGYKL
ncbi:SDR family oxidoreductase [Streptomyces olivaceus]|uniref:SDR family oxidoreductase n=2 Tax=Streptomyces TaxID=1883 RepID=UPI0003A5FACC|nr:SDR family oxidoreductase [Streptomyces olivaceus]